MFAFGVRAGAAPGLLDRDRPRTMISQEPWARPANAADRGCRAQQALGNRSSWPTRRARVRLGLRGRPRRPATTDQCPGGNGRHTMAARQLVGELGHHGPKCPEPGNAPVRCREVDEPHPGGRCCRRLLPELKFPEFQSSQRTQRRRSQPLGATPSRLPASPHPWDGLSLLRLSGPRFGTVNTATLISAILPFSKGSACDSS